MNQKEKRAIKKASTDPVKEAKGHPNGPSLQEMMYGKEEKVLEKRIVKRKNEEPDGGPIPVI